MLLIGDDYINSCFLQLQADRSTMAQALRRGVRRLPQAGLVGPFPSMTVAACRGLATLSPEAKQWQEANTAFKRQLKEVRKLYIEEVKEKKRQEDARKAEELAKIREKKRQRLLLKREKQRETAARMAAWKEADDERRRLFLEKRQKELAEYTAHMRMKQTNLVKSMSDESSLWITKDNVDEKITDWLWEVAGRTTAMPTRFSKQWHYMAVASFPDFSDFPEEHLFDEVRDKHNLVHKSPFPQPQIDLNSEVYAGNVALDDMGNPLPRDPDDPCIYFEDSAWRPSLIGQIRNSQWDEFQVHELKLEDLPRAAELAEKYEKKLLEVLREEGEVEEEAVKGQEGQEEGDDDYPALNEKGDDTGTGRQLRGYDFDDDEEFDPTLPFASEAHAVDRRTRGGDGHAEEEFEPTLQTAAEAEVMDRKMRGLAVEDAEEEFHSDSPPQSRARATEPHTDAGGNEGKRRDAESDVADEEVDPELSSILRQAHEETRTLDDGPASEFRPESPPITEAGRVDLGKEDREGARAEEKKKKGS